MAFARSARCRARFCLQPDDSTDTSRLLAQALAAMHAARQRQAEREIALYLHSIGGKFTDEAEREIERRFLGPRVIRSGAMSTTSLRVHATKQSPLPDLARVAAFFATLIDVFAEAQAQARAASERYPFVE